MAIVKMNYVRGAGGGRVGRAGDYDGRREGPDVERTWHAADGRELDQDEAKEEISRSGDRPGRVAAGDLKRRLP